MIKELDHFKFFVNKPLDGVEFDYCCHPKVGDQIVAFYKDSKAIIHHKLCKKAYEKILAEEADDLCVLEQYQTLKIPFDYLFAESKRNTWQIFWQNSLLST